MTRSRVSPIAVGIFIYSSFLFASITHAQETRLFSNGAQVANYDEKISSLTPGEILVFEDGSRFEFIKYLGSGDVTQVVEVKTSENKKVALRLPKHRGVYRNYIFKIPYVDFIDYFIDHHEVLQKANLIPKVYTNLKGQFVAVEKIDIKFGLEEFLTLEKEIDPQTRARAESELFLFAKKIAPFTEIGDFSVRQVAFDGKKWVIIDFTEVVPLQGKLLHFEFKTHHPFEKMTKFFLDSCSPKVKKRAQKIFDKIDKIIYNERLKFAANRINPITHAPISLATDHWGRYKPILRDIKKVRDHLVSISGKCKSIF